MNKLAWLIVLFIMASVGLNGCSSKDEGGAKKDTPAFQPVSLQLQWVTQAQFAGYYIAFDKGWYREEGIDLSIKPGGPDIVPVDVVASGTADFGTTLLSDLAAAIEKNKPVISIGQIQQKNGLLLIARKSSGIRHPKDFIGKHIGVWLGSWEAQFHALLAREQIQAADVKVMSQGWSMKPFLNGDLDVASAMIYNEYQLVLSSGIRPDELNVIDYADYDLAFPGDVIFTSKHMIDANPELCTRMVQTSIRGWEYAMDHPEEAVNTILKYDHSKIQTKQHQLAMMKEITKLIRVSGHRVGHVDDATLVRMVELLQRYKILNKAIDPHDIFTRSFLDKV